MALLNFSVTYAEVLQDLGVTNLAQLAENSDGYAKLYFTKDGNIITHGLDFLPLFTQCNTNVGQLKGLVPVNTSVSNKNLDFLRGDGTWQKIATTDLPIWQSGNYDATTILNSLQVQQLVNNSFIANEAMRFKGVISSVNDIEDPWVVGDTYRVSTPGTYYGKTCEVGDLLICVTSGSSSDSSKNSHWAAVQSNINGYKEISLNGTVIKVYTNNTVEDDVVLYGPATGGTTTQILVGNGIYNQPIWKEIDALQVGTANKVAKALTVGTGLTMGNVNEYNGSEARTITLVKASTTALGGIKIDSNSGLNGLPTVSIKADGTLYLTATNISNALGFMPTNPDDLQGALTRASRNKDGLAPLFDSLIAPTFSTGTWLLGVNKGATEDQDQFGWFGIPENAFNNTWRDIRIGGQTIGDAALNFKPTDDVYVKVDGNTSDGSYDISFGLSWYNISTGQYETA